MDESLPARGVWIEIVNMRSHYENQSSLPARGVWIEITEMEQQENRLQSLPARGVWIEISNFSYFSYVAKVAPRKGSVD